MIEGLIRAIYSFSFSLFGITYSSSNITGTIIDLINTNSLINKFALFSEIQKVQGSIVAVAESLLTLFFIINLIKLLTQEGVERVSWERITLRACVFFLLSYFIKHCDITASPEESITSAIADVMHWVYWKVAGAMHMPNVSGMNIADELIKIAENASFTDQLMYNALYVILAIPYMATIIMILAQVTLRAVRLAIYLAFAPIPIAMAAEGETYRGKAINYFMSLCGLLFEASIIYIGTYVYAVGMNGIAQNTASGAGKISVLIGILFLNGFFAALISASSQIADKIFGRG